MTAPYGFAGCADGSGLGNFSVHEKPNTMVRPSGRGWFCRIWNWFKFGKEKYDSANDAIDWTLCAVYYVNCLDTGMGINRGLGQAMSTADPVTYATLVAQLAQQTGANSMSQLKLNVCLKNDDNCKKALDCAKKGVLAQPEMERRRFPLVKIPPLRGGDFQGMRIYRPMPVSGCSAREDQLPR